MHEPNHGSPARFPTALSIIVAMAVAAGTAMPPGAARADVLAEDTDVSGPVVEAYWGQAITTPAGGPYDDLVFNFHDGSTPVAAGNLYLFSSPYTGAADGLASASYVAVAAVADGVYTFDHTVTLQDSTQVFLYSDAPQSVTTDTNFTYDNGYSIFNIFLDQGLKPYSDDIDFLLRGDPVDTPEPASLAVLAGALALFTAARLAAGHRTSASPRPPSGS